MANVSDGLHPRSNGLQPTSSDSNLQLRRSHVNFGHARLEVTCDPCSKLSEGCKLEAKWLRSVKWREMCDSNFRFYKYYAIFDLYIMPRSACLLGSLGKHRGMYGHVVARVDARQHLNNQWRSRRRSEGSWETCCFFIMFRLFFRVFFLTFFSICSFTFCWPKELSYHCTSHSFLSSVLMKERIPKVLWVYEFSLAGVPSGEDIQRQTIATAVAARGTVPWSEQHVRQLLCSMLFCTSKLVELNKHRDVSLFICFLLAPCFLFLAFCMPFAFAFGLFKAGTAANLWTWTVDVGVWKTSQSDVTTSFSDRRWTSLCSFSSSASFLFLLASCYY